MSDLGWIAYVGSFLFPVGQPSSRRVYGISCSLAEAGYQVVVGSGEPAPILPSRIEGLGSMSDLSYLGLGEIPPRDASPVAKSYRWLVTLGERTVHWLDGQSVKPSCVILYLGLAPYMVRLLLWCKKNKVPLIIDVVEWFDSHHVQGGPLGPFNISIKTALRFLYPKSDGIIAISSYLKSYYQHLGCQVLRVPPTLDVHNVEARLSVATTHSPQITLAYTGIPGKKDLINNVVEAILRFDPKGKRIRLVLAGPSVDSLLLLPALRVRGYKQLPAWLDGQGVLPFDKALDLIRSADFMPLLRPPLRYAQAGFPTKVPECLSLGTPVICDLTSDLEEYIHDGEEGLICSDHSVESFTGSLERALSLSTQQYLEMRRAARTQAQHSFDYRLYTKPLAEFVMELRHCV